MGVYELTFLVAPLGDEVADRLLDEFDCVVGRDHEHRDYVTVTAPGPEAVAAASAIRARLADTGVHVLRLQPDLVTRNEVAARAGVTRQAVANWVRGERHVGTPFPLAFHDVAGGVWLWGEVAGWLADRRLITSDTGYPTSEEADLINVAIADSRRPGRARVVAAAR